MRGSQYQSPSAISSSQSNHQYRKHLQTLHNIRVSSSFLPPQKVADFQNKDIAFQKIKHNQRQQAVIKLMLQRDLENHRLLTKIIAISHGTKVQVAKADEWQSSLIRNSPLVTDRGRNLQAKQDKINEQNQKLVKYLMEAQNKPLLHGTALTKNKKRNSLPVQPLLRDPSVWQLSRVSSVPKITQQCDIEQVYKPSEIMIPKKVFEPKAAEPPAQTSIRRIEAIEEANRRFQARESRQIIFPALVRPSDFINVHKRKISLDFVQEAFQIKSSKGHGSYLKLDHVKKELKEEPIALELAAPQEEAQHDDEQVETLCNQVN